jgi:uncharacterized oxidoreductase
MAFEGGPWAGRTVVITGATSGIGHEFAVRLVAEGAKVIACGRNDTALRQLQEQYSAIEVFHCDITERSELDALKDFIQQRYARLDVLVNNAGIMERIDLLNAPINDERIANEIAVNLTAPIVLTQRLLPLLRSGQNPLIMMITSGYALLPATRAPTYSATKAGLRSFTMALRRQMRDAGIRVVEVLPPLVDTPATRSVKQPKMPAATLVDMVLREVSRGKDEILPGKVRFLPALMRLSPLLAASIVAES